MIQLKDPIRLGNSCGVYSSPDIGFIDNDSNLEGRFDCLIKHISVGTFTGHLELSLLIVAERSSAEMSVEFSVLIT